MGAPLRFGSGQAVLRLEDEALLRGRGRYTDDHQPEGGLFMAFARSTVARGRLRAVDTGAAAAAPGVVAVFTGEALHEAGVHPLPPAHGFWAPAGTPPEIVDRLNREINRTLAMPAVVEVIRGLGAEPQPITPREFGEVIRSDMARYAKIIQDRKITQD